MLSRQSVGFRSVDPCPGKALRLQCAEPMDRRPHVSSQLVFARSPQSNTTFFVSLMIPNARFRETND